MTKTKAKLKKADMIRAVLQDGITATGEVTREVKKRYGVDVPHSAVSPLRLQVLGQARPATSAPAASLLDTGALLDFEGMQLVKKAVERLGAENVKKLVDLLKR